MSIFSRPEHETIAKIKADAEERRGEGHTVMIVGLLVMQMKAWGDFVEAIESEGWRLESLSTPTPEMYAVAVFRAT